MLRSIREIFVIGHGPSSSHSMGPYNAGKYILNKYQEQKIKEIKITLYGSLAFTGKGHLTDQMLDIALKDIPHTVIFDVKTKKKHPNTMVFEINTLNKKYKETVLSIGGGTIVTKDNKKELLSKEIYPHQTMSEITKYCLDNHLSLYDYIVKYEDDDIFDYFKNVLKAMDQAVEEGLKGEGYLPGELKVQRKAKSMYEEMMAKHMEEDIISNVSVASFAVSEVNASGGIIVTAPTCGSAGVIPGCIRYLRLNKIPEEQIVKGLMVAGLFGMICKTNASISGAEAGCQAEIGVASSMGAALIASCLCDNLVDIVQSAEIALEHSLGLTCDPVCGYVQIPCIERNAVYALKSIAAYKLAIIIPNDSIRVSYDDSVKTMMKTGLDMNKKYKETSQGGLAEFVK